MNEPTKEERLLYEAEVDALLQRAIARAPMVKAHMPCCGDREFDLEFEALAWRTDHEAFLAARGETCKRRPGPCSPCDHGQHELCLRAIDAYDKPARSSPCGCLVCFPIKEATL